MRPIDNPSRRRFLFQSGLGLLAASAVPAWVYAMETQGAIKMTPNRASPNFQPDVEIDLIAQEAEVPILPGAPTRVMQYVASLRKGPEGTLIPLPGSYLGPLMVFRKGQKVRIHLLNKLSEPHITHWHGMHVPAVMDGHPMAAVNSGETFVYEFEVLNRAGLHIYHPHAHHATSRQVYLGLAGGILVRDEEEAALGLPSGEYEIPVVIQDRRFDAQNQWHYAPNDHERMLGYYGDHILVNGKPKVELEVASRAYRLRFLNGSNARIYKLGWSDGTPVTVLGVDGGLLEAPETRPYVMLAPGERLDVWVDFSGRGVGTELVMRSLPFSGALPKMYERMMQRMGGMMKGMEHGSGGGQGMGGMMGMMGGMNQGSASGQGMGGMGMMGDMGMMEGMMAGMMLPVGSEYPIFKVRVTREVSDGPNLPTRLATISQPSLDNVVNPDKPVPIGISEAPLAMLINGRKYAANDFLPSERIPYNTVQLMEIFHAHGGAGGHGGGNDQQQPGHGGGDGGNQPSHGAADNAPANAPKDGGHAMGGNSQGGGMGGGMMGGMMGGGMGHGMMGGMGGQGQGGGMGMMMGGMGGHGGGTGGQASQAGGGMDHAATGGQASQGSGGMDHAATGGQASQGSGGTSHDMGGQGSANQGGQGMGMMGGGMMGGMMGGGTSMSMAHPIHLHGQQFQIISRSSEMVDPEDYATVKDGFIDAGWKDTVLVMSGERVRFIKPFQDFKGVFMFHCHNLEHEDMGMMREFSVE